MIRRIWSFEHWRVRIKSPKPSPRRKPGSRTPWKTWIPALVGTTEKGFFRLLTSSSTFTFQRNRPKEWRDQPGRAGGFFGS